MKDEETKIAGDLCLKRKARDTQNVSTALGPRESGYEDAAAGPRKSKVQRTKRCPRMQQPTSSTPTFFLLSTSIRLFALSACSALASSLAAKPQGSRSGCGISSQAPEGSWALLSHRCIASRPTHWPGHPTNRPNKSTIHNGSSGPRFV
jgi:hypothetical protein